MYSSHENGTNVVPLDLAEQMLVRRSHPECTAGVLSKPDIPAKYSHPGAPDGGFHRYNSSL